MQLDLYYFQPLVTNSARVFLALLKKGVDFTEHAMSGPDFDHLKPDYLAINPKGQVPTLVCEGHVLTEGMLINDYIDEAFEGPRGRYVDVNLSYSPTSTGPALDNVMPIVKALDARKAHPSSTIALSKLTADTLKQSNIVYLGLLSGMGILRAPIFGVSGFTIGSSYEDLIDRKSGKAYHASRGMFDDEHSPEVDFAYLASTPGPAENRMLIVAGTRDAAAEAMAQLVADPTEIKSLLKANGGNPNFEALYQVRSMGGSIMSSKRLLVRQLKVQGIWNGNMVEQQFPDSEQKSRGLEKKKTS